MFVNPRASKPLVGPPYSDESKHDQHVLHDVGFEEWFHRKPAHTRKRFIAIAPVAMAESQLECLLVSGHLDAMSIVVCEIFYSRAVVEPSPCKLG